MPEQLSLTKPNQDPKDNILPSPALGRLALSGVGLSAEHFYGSKSSFMGKASNGEHRLLIEESSKDGSIHNEAIGVGFDVESTLMNSLEKMRSLETLRTKSLAHIEMTDSTFVDFTTLEHYNPKISPNNDTYLIPINLEGLLTEEDSGSETYKNTIAEEGWQTELCTILADYLSREPAGKQLKESLNINSLSHLTPEQAVKLSTAFVQNVSKYSYSDIGFNGKTRADQSTASELLLEGIEKQQDSKWDGNGVCRNIASNVKAVFESLKQTQVGLSMLNNTYCVYSSGFKGAGYADSREDKKGNTGHAWNTFVTIDSEGSAVATIIDATWALGKDINLAIEHLDRTDTRAAAVAAQLFEKSEVKETAFTWLINYFEKLVSTGYKNKNIDSSSRIILCEYVTTLALKSAALLSEIPEDDCVPSFLINNAYNIRAKLDKNEIETLYNWDKISGSIEKENVKAIITGYSNNEQKLLPNIKNANSLTFKDDGLQTQVYEVIGDARVKQLADTSTMFRIRLRGLNPELLPVFDANKIMADAEELRYFGALNNIYETNPKKIMEQFDKNLKRLAGDDDLYSAIITGRTDYDLVKNFSEITKALRKRDKS